MEEALRQRVVGQDHAVAAISDAVRISRAGLQAPNRPVSSFLFLGLPVSAKYVILIFRSSICLIRNYIDGTLQGIGCVLVQ